MDVGIIMSSVRIERCALWCSGSKVVLSCS